MTDQRHRPPLTGDEALPGRNWGQRAPSAQRSRTHRTSATIPSKTAGAAHHNLMTRRTGGSSHSAPAAPDDPMVTRHDRTVPAYASSSQGPSGRMVGSVMNQV
ncbi:hypothetical protein GCM10009601_50500 [Streptomyces thermospinosisporus]|uniref:Uncharacterized protein n=1 Tax=Streptomyces thermospinosisporus TaxID=161482 RepID=A0ABN1Z4H1_9ACTN